MEDRLENGGGDAVDESPRRRLPPQERRQQIVDGAVTFFADVGLRRTIRRTP